MIKEKKRWYMIFSAITLIVSVYFYLMGCLESPVVFFNSDYFALPYLYKNLFLMNGHFHHWFFSSDPFFFPDVVVFLLLTFLVKKVMLAFFLSYAFFLVMYYLLLVAVGKIALENTNKNIFRISALLSIMLAGTYFGNQELFKPSFVNHFATTVVMYLFGLFLVLKILETRKIWFYGCLGLICLLTTFSDPLFFVIFFSVVLSLCILRNFKIAGVILFTGLLGFFTNTHDWLNWNILFEVHSEAFSSSLSDWIRNFLLNPQRYIVFHKVFSIFYTYNPIACLALIAFFFFGNKCLWNILRHKSYMNNQQSLIIVSLTLCIYISVFAGLFLDPGLLIGEQGLVLRHFQTMIILPLFLGVPILLFQFFPRITEVSNQYFIPTISLILITMFLFAPFNSLKKAINYYPPVAECLDNYINNGELTSPNGITNYWSAHVNDALSKTSLNLVSVTGDLKPMNWLSTAEDYQNKKFNFFLLKEGAFSMNAVNATYGKPKKVLLCSAASDYKIYVYEHEFSLKKQAFSFANVKAFSDTLKLNYAYPIIANSPYIKTEGLGSNETGSGIWTISKKVSITLYMSAKKLSENPAGHINFDVSAFLYPGIKAQHVNIFWGNNQKITEAIDQQEKISLPYKISDWKNANKNGSLKKITINFYLPNAMKPAKIDYSSLDYRLLALRFEGFSFTS